MHHTEFVAQLPARTKADLHRRTSAAAMCHLAGHLGAALTCGLYIGLGLPGWGLVLPLQGVVLVFLFTLEHETTHQTPFAHKALNEWVGRVCGLIVFVPFLWFRYFHLAHHRHTHDPKRDPELAGGGWPKTQAAYLWHISGLPYWASMLRHFAGLVRGHVDATYVPRQARPRVVAQARWMLGLYLLALGSLVITPVLFWVWMGPLLLGQPVLRLYLMAEHGRCAHVANMFVNTRTVMTHPVVRWLAWNMPYHAEHHAMPQVPFHRLPQLHAMVRNHLQEVAPSYAAFHRENAPR